MITSEIETLLEKFYEGNTTLQEEKILRDFFGTRDVPAHLKSHQPLFSFYTDEHTTKLANQEFEQKLLAQMEGRQHAIPVMQKQPNRNRFMFITSIAAGFLLLIGLFFTFQHDVFKQSRTSLGKPDTETAYANASGALMLVSGNLNHGLKQVEQLQMVAKAMENMQLFNKFYQCETIIINPDEMFNKSIKSK